MGRSTCLNSVEKAKIDLLRDQGLTGRAIADKVGRSFNVVYSYLKNKDAYGKNMKGGKKTATTAAERRRILRCASNSSDSVAKIKQKVGVNASCSTVLRVINNSSHLKRMKLKKKPPLDERRKMLRLDFSRLHMSWKKEWYHVVFSDEKKFNFDGPDGFNFYFHDLRKEKRFLKRHHSREGGVMIWGAVSYYGTVELEVVTSRMTAAGYKVILERNFPKFSNIFGPINWTYQHDNAPIHSARIIKTWIEEQQVQLLQWPPYSPDLSIIENVWGWLVRKVYEGGRQFEDKETLISAIKLAWSEISLNYIKKLYDSMPDRIYEVIKNKGGSTHY